MKMHGTPAQIREMAHASMRFNAYSTDPNSMVTHVILNAIGRKLNDPDFRWTETQLRAYLLGLRIGANELLEKKDDEVPAHLSETWHDIHAICLECGDWLAMSEYRAGYTKCESCEKRIDG